MNHLTADHEKFKISDMMCQISRKAPVHFLAVLERSAGLLSRGICSPSRRISFICFICADRHAKSAMTAFVPTAAALPARVRASSPCSHGVVRMSAGISRRAVLVAAGVLALPAAVHAAVDIDLDRFGDKGASTLARCGCA